MLNSFRCLQHTLIDEHQPSGIDPIPILGPLRPPTGDIGTILLGGNQRLFCN
jgi:hypothetical protein